MELEKAIFSSKIWPRIRPAVWIASFFFPEDMNNEMKLKQMELKLAIFLSDEQIKLAHV